MAYSSGFISERHSPLSSSEPVSGSASPLVIKPAGVMTHKPRSSSMNSNGSTHSNHTRSLSIISLESPRNSIVSLEDGFTRPPRNDSNVSLSSLAGGSGGKAGASGTSRETLRLSHRTLPKTSTTAITSDEDSEAEQRTVFHYSRRKPRNSEPGAALCLKKDFEFQYGAPVRKLTTQTTTIHKTNVSSSNSSTPDAKQPYDPPPLLLENEASTSRDTSEKNLTKKTKPVNNKANRIHQSIYLKKKLIYSKDLQLELLNANSSIDKNSETRLFDTTLSVLRNTHSNLNPQIKDFDKQPVITTLEHQNKLINKLNEKWNKSLMTVQGVSGPSDKSISDSSEHIARPRKRSRQYLFGDDDDSYDDYDN